MVSMLLIHVYMCRDMLEWTGQYLKWLFSSLIAKQVSDYLYEWYTLFISYPCIYKQLAFFWIDKPAKNLHAWYIAK